MRYGQRVEVQNGQAIADHKSETDTNRESITVTAGSAPPLRAGTYYISVSNCSGAPATFTVTATVSTT